MSDSYDSQRNHICHPRRSFGTAWPVALIGDLRLATGGRRSTLGRLWVIRLIAAMQHARPTPALDRGLENARAALGAARCNLRVAALGREFGDFAIVIDKARRRLAGPYVIADIAPARVL